MDDFEEIGKLFREAMEKIKEDSEAYWNSLSYDEQLKVFCAVSRRIFEGEIKQRGSYRYVLYDIFKFEPDAYVQAQDAGYLAIHNAIYDGERVGTLIKNFCTKHLNIDKETLESELNEFIKKLHF